MRYGFVMHCLDGTQRSLDVPGPDQRGADADLIFVESCDAIVAEAKVRKGEDAAGYSEWVHRTCYEFLAMLISFGHEQLIDERITVFERGNADTERSNAFQRGLLAIFVRKPALMDHSRRERVGKRLWYAYRHYVPSVFLKGFLHQVWTDDEGPRKSVDGFIELGFEQWVARERANDDNADSRGSYPTEIEEAAVQYRLWAPILSSPG